MLLKRTPPPAVAAQQIKPSPGFQHIDRRALATLGWLRDHRVEFVLTGPVAEAVHSRSASEGTVAIVPAPYRRNLERLVKGLSAAEVRLRNDRPTPDGASATVTVENLTGPDVWTLSWGPHQLDVVGTGAPASSGAWGTSGYQELLYEANGFELSPGLTVEVASPEDIEHYAHLRRTGTAPQIKITRQTETPAPDSGPAPTAAPGHDSPPGSG
jgi:hypothetical protein